MEERTLNPFGTRASAASGTVFDSAEMIQDGLLASTAKTMGRSIAAHPFLSLINAGMGIFEYSTNRDNGDGAFKAAAKATGSFVMGEVLGAKMIPFVLGVSAVRAGLAMGENNAREQATGYARRGALGTGYYDMSQAGHTMRQRGITAMQQNGMNINSVLGNEARTFSRSYH